MSGNLLQTSFWLLPAAQQDYFRSQYLRFMFQQKISKSRATGKDGVRIGKFIERIIGESELIERKVLADTYHFTRYKERLLLRGAVRPPRQISIPTVRDRLTLRALCQLFHDKAPASKGFSPHAVVDQVITAVRHGSDARKFVRIDVQNFFPSIVHSKLEVALKREGIEDLVRSLAMAAVKTGTGKEINSDRGVPQGLSVSGALSSIYLASLDKKLRNRFGSYFRYVDDILCIVDNGAEKTTMKSISRSLNSLGLVIHPLNVEGKTEICPLEEGVEFLGYRICPTGVSVRDSSYKRMFTNLLKVITDFRYRKLRRRTLFRLNLKITGCIVDGKRRGWLMFFSRTEDLSQLAFLDRFVEGQLMRVGFPIQSPSDVRRFVAAYHEIRFKLDTTTYVPNFDKYDLKDKASVIADFRNVDSSEIESWDASSIEEEFSRLVSAEVHDLEEDIGSLS